MLLVLPTIAVEVKESCHLMRDLELHVFRFLSWNVHGKRGSYSNSQYAKTSPWQRGGGQMKGLEVDFSADEIENGNGLIGLEKEEDLSSDSFDEI